MGLLSSASNLIFGSSNGPSYSTSAGAAQHAGNTYSDLGNIIKKANSDGSIDTTYQSSDIDNLRNSLAKQGLSDFTLSSYDPTSSSGYTYGSLLSDPTSNYTTKTISDPTTSYTASSISDPSTNYSTTQLYGNINQDTANNAAQSYYDQATRLLNKNYDNSVNKMDERLINRGIQTGTKQYNDTMGSLADSYNGTLSDLANQSVFQGQNLLSTMLGNQAQQTANEGSEMSNKNQLLQNQNQYLQNQAQNTTNEGLVFDNQGKLISNQAGLLSNQGQQTANEGSVFSNLAQLIANQGNQISNEGKVLSNQGQSLSNANLYYGNQGQQLSNINALTGGRDINTLAGIGTADSDAYDNSYNGAQNQYQNQSNKNSQLLNLGTTAAAMYKFSDKRLKENLKPVGKLNNGLKVYVGNYKKETGLDTTPQLFLLAQEVQKKKPEAVAKKYGALAVNYKLATKKGE